MNYLGKHVWIIGASSGIGRALATTLAARGAHLALSARRSDELDSLVAALGNKHRAFTLDVANAAVFTANAEAVKHHFGTIDHVIMLAGVYTPASLAKMDIAEAHKIVDINLMGSINCLHAVLPCLRAQGHGQIALCASVAGYRGLPNAQPYAATKAAIINLAESAYIEESRNGVDVRLISPGFVRTPMTDKNNFSMPMMVSAQAAADAIADGLLSPAFEIHFPKRFTLIMKLLQFLPNALYLRLARR